MLYCYVIFFMFCYVTFLCYTYICMLCYVIKKFFCYVMLYKFFLLYYDMLIFFVMLCYFLLCYVLSDVFSYFFARLVVAPRFGDFVDPVSGGGRVPGDVFRPGDVLPGDVLPGDVLPGDVLLWRLLVWVESCLYQFQAVYLNSSKLK